MIAKVKSCGLVGLDGYIVEVETDIAMGLPAFDIVGLPDAAVKESRERVRAAIKNSGYAFASRRVTINLAPAHIKKEGSVYDLPVAVSFLWASGQIALDNVDDFVFIGELSLNGDIRPVCGVLPMVIAARDNGAKYAIVPKENALEAAVVKGIEILAPETLAQLCDHINGIKKLSVHTVDVDEYFKNTDQRGIDFSEVKGQENVKRALEIAAAGNHNMLMIGSPGSGKSMIAQRLPTILPDMSFEEALEVTKIHSIAGALPDDTPIITTRPFRHPHHTISATGLSGGGRTPKPGEISLAHNGVLFLDELPEFNKDALEVMRQPLEDGSVTIARVSATLTYPCNVMFVASMNPCKCGYYGDPSGRCKCSESQIAQYLGKVSGPLLDRIDLHIEVAPVKYKDLENTAPAESSESIKKRVDAARKIQMQRYKDYNIYSNSQLTPAMINIFCRLGEKERAIIKGAFDRLGLSARAYNRILKVARTIADLDGSENIQSKHIAEAIQYRSLDRKFWS
ncbi:MAG: ATP-binding protein [Ruminococcaceae bacterium]|nr:ATP-binding protein [Oscillospiraceae bacterium]